MLVVVAVILTFITTPFTLLIYPEKHRTRAGAEERPPREAERGEMSHLPSAGTSEWNLNQRFLVVLQKVEHLSSVMLLTQMLEPSVTRTRRTAEKHGLPKIVEKDKLVAEGDLSEASDASPSPRSTPLPALPGDEDVGSMNANAVKVDALKLIELTGRTFSVMQSTEKEHLLVSDDALQLYRQFGRLRGLEVTPHIDIVDQDSYPAAVADLASSLSSQMVVIPWTVPPVANSAALLDATPALSDKEGMPSSASFSGPFDAIFGSDAQGSPMYTHFVRRVFTECMADKALFVDRGFGATSSFAPGSGQHIFLPFFGGPDDRLALKFVVQLCGHAHVSATVVRIESSETGLSTTSSVVTGKEVVDDSIQTHRAAMQSNQLTVGRTDQVSASSLAPVP